MVKLFHSNRVLVLVFLPLIIGVYVTLNLYFQYHLPDTAGFGLWGKLRQDYFLPSVILAPTLIFLNALLLNIIFNRNEFMERNTYIVSLLYVVFMSFFHSFYFVDGLTIAQFFMILSVQQIFWLNQHEDARKRAFNLAFLAGLGATFHPLMLLSLPVLFWIIWVFRPFIFRESLLVIIGFVLPLIYARVFRGYFIDDFSTDEISSSSAERFVVDMITEAVLICIFTFLSIKSLFQKIQLGSIRLRKLYTVINMLAFLILAMLSIDYFFFGKIQTVALVFIILVFILPFAFGQRTIKFSAVFFFYLCFFYSLGKFFIPFIR